MPYPTVNRRLPIINGYVPVPDRQNVNKTTLTPAEVLSLIPESRIVKIGIHGVDQEFVELPEYVFAAPEDWFAILRAAAK
jgi:hypothetical protein